MVSVKDIGICGPPFRFPVEEGKVRELARAVGATDPAYLHGTTPLAPPTFLGIAGRFWGYTFDEPRDTPLAAVELDRSLLLHAEEEYEYPNGLPRAGIVLTAQTRIKDVIEKDGRRGGKLVFVITETEFRGPSGSIVAVSRQTVVKTEKAPA